MAGRNDGGSGATGNKAGESFNVKAPVNEKSFEKAKYRRRSDIQKALSGTH